VKVCETYYLCVCVCGAGSGGCMGSVCRCLAGIPCGALCVFLAFCTGVVACGTSLIVAMRRTRAVIDQRDLYVYTQLNCGLSVLVPGSLKLILSLTYF